MKTLLTALLIPALLAPPALARQVQNSSSRDASAINNTPPSTAGGNAATTTTNVGADYRLGSGDKIRIEVYKEPQLSQSLQIRPDGKITMPLIGDLTATGLTPVQLRDQIGTALKDYVNNPVVTVMVVEALASAVYVMGEVNKPGTVALAGPTTVLQALAMAGGLGQWAKGSRIKILRNGPTGVETIKFNYDDAIKGDGPLLYLQRGDTVIVP
jgi:polysaccharide export outer membrane protein